MARIRILIVDDHATVRVGLRAMFAPTEIEVAGEAATGADALQLALGEPLDVVLLDLGLTDASGLDVLAQIKTGRPDLPVLVYSMHGGSSAVQRSLAAGAFGHLVKGEDEARLADAVRSAAVVRSVFTMQPIQVAQRGDVRLDRTGLEDLPASGRPREDIRCRRSHQRRPARLNRHSNSRADATA